MPLPVIDAQLLPPYRARYGLVVALVVRMYAGGRCLVRRVCALFVVLSTVPLLVTRSERVKGASTSAVAGEVRRKGAPARELQLLELAAVPLPPNLWVQGASLSRRGELVLWDTATVWVHSKGALPERVCLNVIMRPLQVVHAESGGALEVVDSVSGYLLRLPQSRRCVPEVTGRGPEAGSLLWRAKARWISGRIVRADRLLLQEVSPFARPDTVLVPFEQPLRLVSSAEYLPVSANDTLLVTEVDYPFRTLLIEGRRSFVILADPTAQLSASDRRGLRGWISLRMAMLDDGLLQVLADPRSDRRRLIVFDASGRAHRMREIEVAMGVLDADPTQRMLVVLRNVGRSEIVYYRWRWRTLY
jgi:hypothetical protein